MYYGDLGKRIVASIIDSIILGIIGFLLGLVLSFAGVIVAPLASWLYFILMEGGSWHATVGKRVMGLYVAYEDGSGITYATAILRMIGKLLSGLILGIGYLMGFFNEQKQCLHDMIAKTYVLSGQPSANANFNRVYANNVNGYANQNINVGNYDRVPELVGINGPLAGMIYKINDGGLIIGRDTISCQVVVPSTQGKVSRIHCYVTYNPMSGMFVLNDRNSTHGTYLANGNRVSYAQPAALKSGDRFYLATPENTFEVR